MGVRIGALGAASPQPSCGRSSPPQATWPTSTAGPPRHERPTRPVAAAGTVGGLRHDGRSRRGWPPPMNGDCWPTAHESSPTAVSLDAGGVSGRLSRCDLEGWWRGAPAIAWTIARRRDLHARQVWSSTPPSAASASAGASASSSCPMRRLVSDGIYALLRHPNYVGVALEVVGIALWMQAPITGTLFAVTFGFILAVADPYRGTRARPRAFAHDHSDGRSQRGVAPRLGTTPRRRLTVEPRSCWCQPS